MDQQTTLIILGICGFLTVCFGLLVLAFVTIFRFTGRNFLGFLGILARNRDEEDVDLNRVGRVPDLRSIAANADFDAALAKHVVQDELAPTHHPPTAYTGQAGASPTPPPNADPLGGSIPRRYSAPQQGTVGQTPYGAQAGQPTPPPTANDLGWVNPALPSLNDTGALRDLRRRDRDDDDDLIGGLMGDDDGGVLG